MLAELFHRHVLDFPGAFIASNVAANIINIPGGLFGFSGQQLVSSFVNLRVPFGKLFAELTGNPADFKIAARMVLDFVTPSTEFPCEFVVIDVLHILPREKHFVILQRLPTLFHWIKSGIEKNAMAVEMWIEGTRSIVPEDRANDIGCWTV